MVFEAQGIFSQQKTCFGEVNYYVFAYEKFALTEIIVEEQFSIQMVYAMLNPISKSSSDYLLSIVTIFVTELQLDLLIAGDEELDEGNDQAAFLHFHLLAHCLGDDWIDVGLKLMRVTIAFACMCA
jgi:hypothetical protein